MGLYSLVIDLPLEITEIFNKISLLKIPDFPLKVPPKAKSALGDAPDQQRLWARCIYVVQFTYISWSSVVNVSAHTKSLALGFSEIRIFEYCRYL